MEIVCSQASKKKEKEDNKVYFIPTLHNFHKIDQAYNYDSVRAIVQRVNPDIIAVEIRAIDIDEDTTVLNKAYPHEFVMMKKYFPNKKIVGFDWWEESITKTKTSDLPADYFNHLLIKSLGKQLEKDSINRKKMEVCYEYQKERLSIIKNASLKEILESKDRELVKTYYACMKEQLKDTPYYGIYSLSEERDRHILKKHTKYNK